MELTFPSGTIDVAKSLFGNLAGSHIPISTYQRIFYTPEFNSYFKFAFVRNPWDRLVSAYRYLMAGGGQNEHDTYIQQLIIIRVPSRPGRGLGVLL